MIRKTPIALACALGLGAAIPAFAASNCEAQEPAVAELHGTSLVLEPANTGLRAVLRFPPH